MGVLIVNLKNIYFDNNFDKDNPDTLILVRLLAWHSKVINAKYLKKKSEELVLIAWHPKRWCNFCMSENKKKNRANFYMKHFATQGPDIVQKSLWDLIIFLVWFLVQMSQKKYRKICKTI